MVASQNAGAARPTETSASRRPVQPRAGPQALGHADRDAQGQRQGQGGEAERGGHRPAAAQLVGHGPAGGGRHAEVTLDRVPSQRT